MKADELRNLLKKQPFQPFVIHLPEGRQVRVAHHDFALLTPDGRTLVAYETDTSLNIIDVLLISSIQMGPAPAGAPGPEQPSPKSRRTTSTTTNTYGQTAIH